MNNNNITPVKIKVGIVDDDNMFDAYELINESGSRVEWNSGGYTHPHFDKENALKIMELCNSDNDYYETSFIYNKNTDTFTEYYCGDFIDNVAQNEYGLYDICYDLAWVKHE